MMAIENELMALGMPGPLSLRLADDMARNFLLDVGLGRIPGASRITASGVNPDVDTGTVPEDIWFAGGVYPFPTATATLEALSDSAADAAAGTGMRTMQVIGLDANYAEQTETVTMNGTTPVALANSYLRLNRAQVSGAGSGRVNAGNVTIRETGGGQTRGSMRAGYGIMRQAIYTVPAGYTMAVTATVLSILRTVGSDYDATFVEFFQSPEGFYRQTLEVAVNTAAFEIIKTVPILIPEKWDFAIRCTGVSASNMEVSATFHGVQILNTLL
jgi:hypothetical protein